MLNLLSNLSKKIYGLTRTIRLIRDYPKVNQYQTLANNECVEFLGGVRHLARIAVKEFGDQLGWPILSLPLLGLIE